MSPVPGIVSLGGLNMDLIVETPQVARAGETREGTRFTTTPGGKGGNQAVAAARVAGGAAAVQMVARVGGDAFGTEMRHYLESAGVGTRFVRADSSSASGVAIILIAPGGENSVNAVYGANALCDDRQVDDAVAALAGASVLLVQQEIPLEVTAAVMRAARGSGVTVILDPAPTRDLPPGLLDLVDIVTPNQLEAEALTGVAVTDAASAQAAARELQTLGPPTVVVTLGAGGAYVHSEALSRHFPAFDVQPIATVAAGDAFNGGLAAGLAVGMELPEAVRLGMATAALCVTRHGAQASMPVRAEVDALLKEGRLRPARPD
ncbi:MAG: ribokinase [Tepidiformaceae bacterium]